VVGKLVDGVLLFVPTECTNLLKLYNVSKQYITGGESSGQRKV